MIRRILTVAVVDRTPDGRLIGRRMELDTDNPGEWAQARRMVETFLADLPDTAPGAVR